jgi:hypothetical protein
MRGGGPTHVAMGGHGGGGGLIDRKRPISSDYSVVGAGEGQ